MIDDPEDYYPDEVHAARAAKKTLRSLSPLSSIQAKLSSDEGLTHLGGLRLRHAQWRSEKLLEAAQMAVIDGDLDALSTLIGQGFNPDEPAVFEAPIRLCSPPRPVESSLLGLALALGEHGRGAAKMLLAAGANPNVPVFEGGHSPSTFTVSRFCFLLDDPEGLELLAQFGADPAGFDALMPPPTISVAKNGWRDEGEELKKTGEPAQWVRVPQSHWAAESLRSLAPKCAQWVQEKIGEEYVRSFALIPGPESVVFNLTKEEGQRLLEKAIQREKEQAELREKLEGRARYFGSQRDSKREAPEHARRSCPTSYFYEGLEEQLDHDHEAVASNGLVFASAKAADRAQKALGGHWPQELVFWRERDAESHSPSKEAFRDWAIAEAEKDSWICRVETGMRAAAWEPSQRKAAAAQANEKADWALCEPVEAMARALLCAEFVGKHDAKNLAAARGASALKKMHTLEKAEVFCAALFLQFSPAIGLEKAASWLKSLIKKGHRSSHEMDAEQASLLQEKFSALHEARELSRATGEAPKKKPRGTRRM